MKMSDALDLRCALTPDLPPDPGIYPNVPPETYHKWAALSSTQINVADRSMAHLDALRRGAMTISSGGFGFGTLAHQVTIEPERDLSEFAFYPEFGDLRTKIGKDARNRWLASVGMKGSDKDGWEEAVARFGDRLVPESDIGRAREVSANIRAHPMARKLLEDNDPSMAELSVVWIDEETSLPCKIRVDVWAATFHIMADLKTTADGSRPAFERSVLRYGYHRQAAWYRHGWSRQGPRYGHNPDLDFAWIVVESAEPFPVAVYTPDDATLRTGSIEAKIIKDRVAQAIKTGHWPGYGEDVMTLSLPPYAVADERMGGEL